MTTPPRERKVEGSATACKLLSPSRRAQLLEALALIEDAQAIITMNEAYVLQQHRQVSVPVLQATVRILARITRRIGTTLCAILEVADGTKQR